MHAANTALNAFHMDGTPITPHNVKRMALDGRQCFRANDTGIVYDTEKAMRLVNATAREVCHIIVAGHPPDDDLKLLRVMAANITIPGVALFYRDPATGEELYQVIDGNHRIEKCRLLGKEFFPVFPLTPDEARSCEWFVIAPTMPPAVNYIPYEYKEMPDGH